MNKVIGIAAATFFVGFQLTSGCAPDAQQCRDPDFTTFSVTATGSASTSDSITTIGYDEVTRQELIIPKFQFSPTLGKSGGPIT